MCEDAASEAGVVAATADPPLALPGGEEEVDWIARTPRAVAPSEAPAKVNRELKRSARIAHTLDFFLKVTVLA